MRSPTAAQLKSFHCCTSAQLVQDMCQYLGILVVVQCTWLLQGQHQLACPSSHDRDDAGRSSSKEMAGGGEHVGEGAVNTVSAAPGSIALHTAG
ncbi:hypothetical protein HaLaN_19593 [Haematococcus lacustris]|uniref:Uncharacterized protein n=1 Tax=Haematococcus lacustris TaxID=44745 RepID=A0A6A0A0E6_HAELA|nr:hypothetical protein HaLaN_19593 [Haematococcus lacustris]